MTDEDREVSSKEAPDTITLSRRSIIAAALAAGFVASTSRVIANSPSTGRLAPDVEGFFFLHSQSSAGVAQPRMFFIKSEWLSYFEITDLYNEASIGTVADKIKKNHLANKSEWHVLYSDDLNPNDAYQSNLTIAELPPPPNGKTYLAMSISPA